MEESTEPAADEKFKRRRGSGKRRRARAEEAEVEADEVEVSTEESAAEPMRLQRYLAMAGIGSRRHCEEYILTGRVTVDRQTISELGYRIDPDRQQVRLDGERIIVQRKLYYLVNKPRGLLCTNNDPQGRRRVIDLFPKDRARLFTVGRLDENSQGLLLVTNDGELANRLAHPRFQVTKIYRVLVAGVPQPDLLDKLKEGIHFAEGVFQVVGAKFLKTQGSSAILEITLREGQNREIRRLMARVGHKVMRLERIALGPLKLGTLPSGEYRPLTEKEIEAVHKCAEEGHRRLAKSSTGKPRSPRAKRAQPQQTAGSVDRKKAAAESPAPRGAGPRKIRAKRPAGKRKEF